MKTIIPRSANSSKPRVLNEWEEIDKYYRNDHKRKLLNAEDVDDCTRKASDIIRLDILPHSELNIKKDVKIFFDEKEKDEFVHDIGWWMYTKVIPHGEYKAKCVKDKHGFPVFIGHEYKALKWTVIYGERELHDHYERQLVRAYDRDRRLIPIVENWPALREAAFRFISS